MARSQIMAIIKKAIAQHVAVMLAYRKKKEEMS